MAETSRPPSDRSGGEPPTPPARATEPGSSAATDPRDEPGELDLTASPDRYLERVSYETGEILPDPIRPEELLIQKHRDAHPVDIHARFMMSRVVRRSGSEDAAIDKMRRMRALGRRMARGMARLTRQEDPDRVSAKVFGLHRQDFYFRFKDHGGVPEEAARKVAILRRAATEKLAAVRGDGGVRALLTGGTGFVGKEILWQAADDPAIHEVIVLVRPQTVRDRKTGEVLEVLGAEERGRRLLSQLWLADRPEASKFRFVEGDVEEAGFGLGEAARDELAGRVTHLIHCAASVAFDAPYEESFRANVLGTLNALRFSRELSRRPGSPFVAHVAIETSYIHGRQLKALAREEELVFPANYYNNYYELTKAMASLETERFLHEGLPLTQLCPTIVIGEAATGNNRGDTKVVNAPVNVFGRAATAGQGETLGEKSKIALLTRLARVFPGDPTARINLIPVDRVAAGVLAALHRAEAVGRRIHLANDRLITTAELAEIIREELEIDVKLVDPTLHRNVGLPAVRWVLARFGQEKPARVLDRLNAVFGGYSEWGQPVHEVGNDVRILGLPENRSNPRRTFRMLCRHNRFVQDFGRLRDADELSRREKAWREFTRRLEAHYGQPAADLPAAEFHRQAREAREARELESERQAP